MKFVEFIHKINPEIRLGLLICIGGLALVYFPLFSNHEGFQTKENSSVAYTDNVKFNQLSFHYVTNNSPQYLRIHYDLERVDSRPAFIAFIIPYEGTITTQEWNIEGFPSERTFVIYKNVTCASEESCGIKQEDIIYTFKENIDSTRYLNQYLQLPYAHNPSSSQVIDFLDSLKSKTSINFGWDKIDPMPYVRVTIDKGYDEWSTQPQSIIKPIPNPNGGNNIIIEWQLTNNDQIFTLDFSRTKDHFFVDFGFTIGGILFGLGSGYIFFGVSEIRNLESRRKLEKFIKIQRHMQDANTAFILKDYESAKQSYDLAIKNDPSNTDSILLAGNSFYKMKQYDDAIPYYKKILELNPNHVGALNNIGACIAGLGKHDESIEYYEKALENNPNHIDALNNIGAAINDLEFPDYAIPYFDEVLLLDKKNVNAISNKGKAISAIDHNQAIKYFDDALKINPNDIQTLTFKGLSLNELKRFDEALACWNLVLKIEPTNKIAVHNKGTALINLDKFDEALLCYEEFLITNPNDSGAVYNKGLCLLQKKEYNKTSECFKRAIQLGIDDLGILNNIGIFFVDHDDPNVAIKDCFQKILKVNKKDLNGSYGMFKAFDKLGNKSEAQSWYAEFEEVKKDSELKK